MKQRQLWPDLVRVIAIFLMVVLHVSAGYVTMYPNLPLLDWWMANLIESLTRVCVPLFFILSGSLILGRKEDLANFYSRRFGKLLVPWSFWSLIYGVISLLNGEQFDSVFQLVVYTAWSGFWILPIFLGLYVATPFFNWLTRKLGNDFTMLFLILMGGLLMMGIHLPIYFEYSFFYVLGMLLKKINLNLLQTYLLGLVTIFIWFFIAVMTDFSSALNNVFTETYYHYYSWTVVLLSASLFVLLKQIAEFEGVKKLGEAIAELSQASFAIYFIHMIVFKLGLNLIILPSYIFIPLLSLGLYLFSYLLVKSARENKLLSQLVG